MIGINLIRNSKTFRPKYVKGTKVFCEMDNNTLVKDGSNGIVAWLDKSNNLSLGLNITDAYNFTNWTTVAGTTVLSANSFSTNTVSGVYKSVLTNYGVYSVEIAGTISSGILSFPNAANSPNLSGTFDTSFIMVHTTPGNLYIRTNGAATVTITKFIVKEISGNHLLQTSQANRPLHQSGAIVFDGSNDFLKANTFTLIQPITVYLVVNKRTSTTTKWLIEGNTGYSMSLYIYNDGRIGATANNSNFLATTSTVTFGNYNLIKAVFNNTQSEITIGETIKSGNVGIGSPNGLVIGSYLGNSDYSDINCKLIWVLNKIPTTAEDNQIKKYIKRVTGL